MIFLAFNYYSVKKHKIANILFFQLSGNKNHKNYKIHKVLNECIGFIEIWELKNLFKKKPI